MTPDEFDDVVRLTALADDLQRRLDVAVKEVVQLRDRTRELERRLAEATRAGQQNRQSLPESRQPTPPPMMNRRQRRDVERVQRRIDVQQRRPTQPS